MMSAVLGYIAGVLTTTGGAVLMLAFKDKTEAVFMATGKRTIQQIREMVGPKKKGAIFMPSTDLEEAREAIISKNKAAGLDTPISEISDE